MFPRLYGIVFTNGFEHRQISVEADDLAHARQRAGDIAQGIIGQRSRDMSDWSQWRIVIQTRDEGRTEDPFPEQALALEEAPAMGSTGLTDTGDLSSLDVPATRPDVSGGQGKLEGAERTVIPGVGPSLSAQEEGPSTSGEVEETPQ
jgi:hypothetical protein